MAELEDELQALQSLYCHPGEYEITDFGNCKEIKINLNNNIQNNNPVNVNVCLWLPENYPENIPNILLNSPQLKREILSILRKDATDCANERRGECMVFSILQNIQDNLEKICHNSSTVQEDSKLEQSSEIWNVLLSLDHMRAKTKYIKTIEKWTNELNIQGRLLFYGKLIFILLQGEHSSIKEYIVRQRSVNVDIDSRGRSCKERMLSVICEEKAEGQKRFKDFSVVECDFVDDIVKLFTEWDLTYIYSKYIKDIYL